MMKNKKSFIIILLLIIISLVILVVYKKNTEFAIPKLKDIVSIGLEVEGNKKTISSVSDIKSIIDELESINESMFSNIDNSKIKKDKKVIINFYGESEKNLTVHLYKDKDNYYLETNNGINLIKEENYLRIMNYLEDNYINYDRFYTNDILKNYSKINELNEDYKIDESKDFVISHSKAYNKNILEEFISNYQNNKEAFMRIIQSTVEGDTIIYDVRYNKDIDKIVILYDSTRDKLINLDKRIIKKYEYEKISEYQYHNDNYLVLYNGDLNDGTLYSDSSLILGIIA